MADEGCEACDNEDMICEGCGCCQECCNCTPSDCDCSVCADRRTGYDPDCEKELD